MTALTFESLSAVPRHAALPVRRRPVLRAVAPAELSTKSEDRYAVRNPKGERKKLALAVAAVAAVGLHIAVVSIVNRPMEIKPLPRKVPEMALEIAPPPPPQVEPPKPVPQAIQPKAAPRPAPANLPVVQNPSPTSDPGPDAVQVAQAQPPAPPAPPPPAPEPVSEPKGYAGYLNNPAPTYPSAAQLRRLQGRVVLKVHVLASGQPDSVDVAQSSGYDILDQAAVKAVTAWMFDPAKRGTKPIDGWVNVPINFKLS